MENEIIEVGRKGRFLYLSAHKDTLLCQLEAYDPHYEIWEGKLAVMTDPDDAANFIWVLFKIREQLPMDREDVLLGSPLTE